MEANIVPLSDYVISCPSYYVNAVVFLLYVSAFLLYVERHNQPLAVRPEYNRNNFHIERSKLQVDEIKNEF